MYVRKIEIYLQKSTTCITSIQKYQLLAIKHKFKHTILIDKVGFKLNWTAFVQNWNPESLMGGRYEVFNLLLHTSKISSATSSNEESGQYLNTSTSPPSTHTMGSLVKEHPTVGKATVHSGLGWNGNNGTPPCQVAQYAILVWWETFWCMTPLLSTVSCYGSVSIE